MTGQTWADRIAAAKRRGGFDAADRRNGFRWDRCPVAERFNTPFDALVESGRWDVIQAGVDFYCALIEDDIPGAEAAHTKIMGIEA